MARKPYTWRPGQREKHLERLARTNADPGHAASLEKARKNRRVHLPPMTEAQRELYRVARSAGIPRERALPQVLAISEGAPESAEQ